MGILTTKSRRKGMDENLVSNKSLYVDTKVIVDSSNDTYLIDYGLEFFTDPNSNKTVTIKLPIYICKDTTLENAQIILIPYINTEGLIPNKDCFYVYMRGSDLNKSHREAHVLKYYKSYNLNSIANLLDVGAKKGNYSYINEPKQVIKQIAVIDVNVDLTKILDINTYQQKNVIVASSLTIEVIEKVIKNLTTIPTRDPELYAKDAIGLIYPKIKQEKLYLY